MEVKLRTDQETHLHKLCERLGMNVEDFVRRAVLTWMEDTEDGLEADEIMQRVHRGEEKTTVWKASSECYVSPQ